MTTLPKPVGPAAPVPANAILLAFDLHTGASYYQVGRTVWKLHGDQWTVYGPIKQWPEALGE